MNIEDIIRAVNPVRPGDVEDALSPGAQHTLARVLQSDATPGVANGRAPRAHRSSVPPGLHSRHGPPSSRPRKRKLIMISLAAVAAGATAAGLVLAVPGAARRPAPTAAPGPKAHPSATSATPQYTSARQVLLTAAANVASAPASGRYWRLQEVKGMTWPAGTQAHPYDISVSVSFDQWNPRSPTRKNWDIYHENGAVPATPADAAAWRAVGSPTSWQGGTKVFGTGTRNVFPAGTWKGILSTSTTHSAQGASQESGNGIVGYVEGDESGLTASQFAAVPTTQGGVLAFLQSFYNTLPGCHKPTSGCSSENMFVWSEALALLQDPVSAQVRSATFKVMASLPGVTSIGPVTDPLGRHGYGLLTGSLALSPPATDSRSVVVIDPQTGSLLATEFVGPMPRSVQCETVLKGGTCVGPAFVGRSYQNQVQEYTALVNAGWTDASPVLPPPSTWQISTALPADPAIQFVPCDLTGCYP